MLASAELVKMGGNLPLVRAWLRQSLPGLEGLCDPVQCVLGGIDGRTVGAVEGWGVTLQEAKMGL